MKKSNANVHLKKRNHRIINSGDFLYELFFRKNYSFSILNKISALYLLLPP